MRNTLLAKMAVLAAAWLLAGPALAAEQAAEGGGASTENAGANWENWHADNDVRNIASLQHGARNFINYCLGCHSLKYLRYSRMATDLHITDQQLQDYLIPTGDKPTDYILSSMPAADATKWFGKEPPDLSLIARSRSPDYIYRFLKTFYLDPSTPSSANNLQLANTAMPAVLSDLEGVKEAVFHNVDVQGEDGQPITSKEFSHFETIAPGKLSASDYDAFVRDTVNFLDYAGDPTQVKRRDIGVWVVLFLLVFTWLAWLLKKEYWKDVH